MQLDQRDASPSCGRLGRRYLRTRRTDTRYACGLNSRTRLKRKGRPLQRAPFKQPRTFASAWGACTIGAGLTGSGSYLPFRPAADKTRRQSCSSAQKKSPERVGANRVRNHSQCLFGKLKIEVQFQRHFRWSQMAHQARVLKGQAAALGQSSISAASFAQIAATVAKLSRRWAECARSARSRQRAAFRRHSFGSPGM